MILKAFRLGNNYYLSSMKIFHIRSQFTMNYIVLTCIRYIYIDPLTSKSTSLSKGRNVL